MLRSIVTHPKKLSPCRHYNISCQLLSPWRFFCLWDQTIPLEPFLENIKKVTKHVDGFLPKILTIFQNMLIVFFVKNIEHIAKHGWMDLLPDLRIARSTTPAGGRQGQERSRKNRGGNNNQHLKKKSFHDTPVLKRHIWGWQKNPKKKTTAVDMCRVYKWEERLGIEREQNLSKSSPDLSRWTGSFILHVGLICYEAKIHVKKSMIGI